MSKKKKKSIHIENRETPLEMDAKLVDCETKRVECESEACTFPSEAKQTRVHTPWLATGKGASKASSFSAACRAVHTLDEASEVPARGCSLPVLQAGTLGGNDKTPEEILDGKRNLKDIADDIIASYETRVKVVGGIIEDTHKTMDDFKEKRETMAEELQGVLAKSESLRKKDFDRMMVGIVSRQNEREKQVREMLENFRKEEEMVAEKLKKLLTKGEEIRIKDFKKMMADIRQEQERRVKQTGESITDQLQDMRGEVHTMLDNFKKERQSVATAWHEMLGLFHQEKSTANLGNPGSLEDEPPPEEINQSL